MPTLHKSFVNKAIIHKSFIIENFGCQMNLSDTEEVKNSLLESGFCLDKAGMNPDIIIVNSCAVRETAENRVYAHIKYYHESKYKHKPIFVLMGCVAQKEKHHILKTMPWIDIVIGTHEKSRTATILSDYILEKKDRVYTDFGGYEFMSAVPSSKYPFKAELTIIHGCNKFCSYCIVPFTRGHEISRNSKDIIDNVKSLINKGVSEILLLGQNVNSYNQDKQDLSFPELLYKLSSLGTSLKRIRFLTSHPIDFTDELIAVIKECTNICKYVHLPLQSASNSVLEKMEREYTFEHYINIIQKLRKEVPSVSLSTDILVGFPSETDKDFEKTLSAIKDIRFDSAYMFKYSSRSGTKASNYKSLLSDSEKQRRLSTIIEEQARITKEQNQKIIGSTKEILFEGLSKQNKNELLGKTDCYKSIVAKASKALIGQYRTVKIDSLKGNTFCGSLIHQQ